MPSLTLTQYFLTFFFVFATVYGVLVKSKVFEKQKGVNLTIALVMAFFSIAYQPLTAWLVVILPIAVIILLVIFGLLLVKSVLGKEKEDLPTMLGVLVIFLLVLAYTQQLVTYQLSQDVVWVISIFIVLVMFYLGSKSSGSEKQ